MDTNAISLGRMAPPVVAGTVLADKLKVYPSRLSAGQQRVPIARALALSAEYMLVGEVLDTLRMLASEGMTMICVTHEMKFAREVSDRVAFFHQGVMVEIAPPGELFENPQKAETRAFLAATH